MDRGSSGPRIVGSTRHAGLLRAGLLLAFASSPSPALPAADTCSLCGEELDVPVVRLTATQLDSIASGHAAFNVRQLARIDSLLHEGTWGASEDPHARRIAHELARLSLSTAYRDLAGWALAKDCVYELDGATLAELSTRYADLTLFVGPRLARLRIGRGRVCVRYSLERAGEGESWHGGRKLRWKVRDAKIEGRKRRVLDVTMPTGQDGEVRFLLSSHHTMSVSYERSAGPPAPFEWFLVHDIEGAWIRKWGTHRPSAYMLWRSTPTPGPPVGARSVPISLASSRPSENRAALSLPERPLLGVGIYVPDLKLRLPLLPDINVEDLRELEVIMPVLELEFLRHGDQPDWLELNRHLGFRDWLGLGPVPPEIRRRFPDR